MNDTASGQGLNNPQVKTALEVMGKMLNIASIYGTKHPSFKTPLEETFRAFNEALRSESRVVLGVFNKTLTVNDRMVTDYSVHLRALERKLVSLETPHLIFELGLTKDEIHQAVEILTLTVNQSKQTLKERIDEAELDHIKAETVEYVAQHEGEKIVGEDEGIGRGEGGTDKDGLGGDKDSETEANVHVEQIMAFLKGDLSAKKAASKDMKEMLSDPEKLGQLIMESVEVRQTA
ncbi:MAG TPA: hypothetical protein VJ904_01105, partial [Tichowtungia sp.]|nr:hypothetical protein [Tichowtungia sp.]